MIRGPAGPLQPLAAGCCSRSEPHGTGQGRSVGPGVSERCLPRLAMAGPGSWSWMREEARRTQASDPATRRGSKPSAALEASGQQTSFSASGRRPDEVELLAGLPPFVHSGSVLRQGRNRPAKDHAAKQRPSRRGHPCRKAGIWMRSGRAAGARVCLYNSRQEVTRKPRLGPTRRRFSS